MFRTYRCRKKTEAYRCTVFEELPDAFCIQLLRFSNNGRKMHVFVEYPELLKMQQVESKMEDVELILEEQYHLVAVISHHGNNLMSGHYTAIALRNGQWFNLDDSQVSEILGLTARNQEAYILMCKRNTTKKINTVSPISFPHPNQSSIEIFDSTPSNYYIEISSTSYCAPRVCRTKRSNERLIYKPISEFQAKQAKLKAYEDQDPSTHSRLKGYLSKDLLSLLPGSWLNNFVLNKYMWILEAKCKAFGNKVRTINSEVFNAMTSPSIETFTRNQYHKMYDDILSCDVILSAVNFGNHWYLLTTFPQLRMMMFLDSLYEGVSARQSFHRMQYFLECSRQTTTKNTFSS